MEDIELRIHAKHLLQTVFHRENASDNNGTSRLDIGFTCKNLRESLHHSLGNTLMLDSSERRQFAIPTLSIITYQFNFLQCFLTLGSQFTLLLRLEQREVRHIIGLLSYHIA